MKVRFLGTGTSQGVPVIACDCAACMSENPKDKRLRTSAIIEIEDLSILIDIGPDFRQQMLTNRIKKLDAVILTHEHNDHVIGADDLRPFNFRQRKDMPIYGEERVLNEIKKRFDYAFKPHPYPGLPQFLLKNVSENINIRIGQIEIVPIRVMHAQLPIFGYRFQDFCYLTDVKTIPESEFSKMKGVKVLVLNALRKRPHHSHLTIEEAITISRRINPEITYLTHFSHDLGPVDEWAQDLPANILPAYDGLNISI